MSCDGDMRPVFFIANNYRKPYCAGGLLAQRVFETIHSEFKISEIRTRLSESRIAHMSKFFYEPVDAASVPSRVLKQIRNAVVIVFGISNFKAFRFLHRSNRIIFYDMDDEDEILLQKRRFSETLREKLAFSCEIAKVRWIYEELKKNADVLKLSISSESKWWAASIGPIAQVTDPIWKGDSRKLAFVGSLDWFPNIDAINTYIYRLAEEEGYDFTVCGGKKPYRVWGSKEILKSSRIHLVENPESLDEYYRSCRLFLSPITMGSGVNFKILHAFMHGIPVLLSQYSLRGYEDYSLSGVFSSYDELRLLLAEYIDDIERLRDLARKQRQYAEWLNSRNRTAWLNLIRALQKLPSGQPASAVDLVGLYPESPVSCPSSGKRP